MSLNPPNHEGYYLCGICAKPVFHIGMELHHDEGRDGDNFSDFTKLKPTHPWCNQMVGSKKKQSIVSNEEYEFRKGMDL